MSIIEIIRDIFIDHREKVVPIFLPLDLTEHYSKELWDHSLDAIYIATKYSEIVDVLTRYKYHSEREHVDLFVDLLSKIVDLYNIKDEIDTVIIPVPMHWSRYMMRGFDHTHSIVSHLSKKTEIPYEILLRTRWTRHQSKLSREKRLENKKNTFKMKHRESIPHTIILFDDVISSWSTAHECAKVLKEAWVQKVIWIFLASNI